MDGSINAAGETGTAPCAHCDNPIGRYRRCPARPSAHAACAGRDYSFTVNELDVLSDEHPGTAWIECGHMSSVIVVTFTYDEFPHNDFRVSDITNAGVQVGAPFAWLSVELPADALPEIREAIEDQLRLNAEDGL